MNTYIVGPLKTDAIKTLVSGGIKVVGSAESLDNLSLSEEVDIVLVLTSAIPSVEEMKKVCGEYSTVLFSLLTVDKKVYSQFSAVVVKNMQIHLADRITISVIKQAIPNSWSPTLEVTTLPTVTADRIISVVYRDKLKGKVFLQTLSSLLCLEGKQATLVTDSGWEKMLHNFTAVKTAEGLYTRGSFFWDLTGRQPSTTVTSTVLVDREDNYDVAGSSLVLYVVGAEDEVFCSSDTVYQSIVKSGLEVVKVVVGSTLMTKYSIEEDTKTVLVDYVHSDLIHKSLYEDVFLTQLPELPLEKIKKSYSKLISLV